MKNNKSLMERLIEAGYPREEMYHHCSDLYVFVTPISTKIIDEWCNENRYRRQHHCPIFTDQITGKQMYDCAFQWVSNS